MPSPSLLLLARYIGPILDIIYPNPNHENPPPRLSKLLCNIPENEDLMSVAQTVDDLFKLPLMISNCHP